MIIIDILEGSVSFFALEEVLVTGTVALVIEGTTTLAFKFVLLTAFEVFTKGNDIFEGGTVVLTAGTVILTTGTGTF